MAARLRRLALLAACLFALAPPLLAQEPPPPEGEKPEEGIQTAPVPQQESPMEILQRIGVTLSRVEDLLARVSWDAEAGAAQKAVLDDIDRLLDETGKEQEQVIEDIDKLIRLAKTVGKGG